MKNQKEFESYCIDLFKKQYKKQFTKKNIKKVGIDAISDVIDKFEDEITKKALELDPTLKHTESFTNYQENLNGVKKILLVDGDIIDENNKQLRIYIQDDTSEDGMYGIYYDWIK